jgi:hypothetical protein
VAQTHSLPRILYGLTFSPARGLFSFSPHLLIGALALGLSWRLRTDRFWWCMWAWIIAHLAVIARFDPWWGGFGYGPRLLADTLPAWMLVLVFAWQAREQIHPLLYRGGAWAYLAAASVAVWINAYNGLYNPATLAWNSLPMSVDGTPGRMFDWGAPQFAATRDSLCANGMAIAHAHTEPAAPSLAVVRAGERIAVADASAQPARFRLINWWLPEGPIVWSGCATAAVVFGPAFANDIVRADGLALAFATRGEQTVQITLNDVVIGRVSAAAGEATYEFPVDARLWRSPGNNRLEFSTDLAATRNPADPRAVGVALRWIAFRPPAAP